MNVKSTELNKMEVLKSKYAMINVIVDFEYNNKFDMISLTKVKGKIKKFVVPDFVELIGESCFSNNKNIEEVYIRSKNTKRILKEAFKGCSNLKKVDMLNSGIVSIGAEAFSECNQLRTIRFSDMIYNIGRYAFFECRSLKALDIPKLVKVASMGMCGECSKLEKVSHNFEIINDVVFCNTKIKHFDFSSVKEIGNKAFSFSTLHEIVLKDIKIGSEAFSDMQEVIERVYIENVESFLTSSDNDKDSSGIFHDTIIRSLTLKHCNVIPPYTFYNSNLKEINGMDTVTRVYGHAFKNCDVGKGFTLQNVKYIGKYAFCEAVDRRCIDTLELRDLDYIGEYAFKSAMLGRKYLIESCKIIRASSFYQKSYMNLGEITINNVVELSDILSEYIKRDKYDEAMPIEFIKITQPGSFNFIIEGCRFNLSNIKKIDRNLLQRISEIISGKA